MRIAVFGCGAMGSIYAGLLATSGHHVTCIDRNQAHVDAINTHGLRVSGASGDRLVQLKAYTHAPDDKVDFLIIALKAAHVSASNDARPMLAKTGAVLTIQNGLGSADIVAGIFGAERLIVGVAQGFGASLPEPGHSHHNDMKAIRMGSYVQGDNKNLNCIVGAFDEAGFDAEAVNNIEVIQWEKLICNVAYSGPCALTGMTVGEVLDDPTMGPVSRAAAVEAWNIAKKRGIPIEVDDPVAYIKDFAQRMRTAKPSVLLDIEAGRLSEIGVINGAVEREASRVGAAAPVNATITALVHSLEERTLQEKRRPKGH
ncbi:MAG: 2-dehydropantoate 2-reductase [Candidatus Azotimanducaceae bacterium]|jgi:2-dehydropantoate 2-reductase